jgi:DNA polymerase-3 subunit epsilon
MWEQVFFPSNICFDTVRRVSAVQRSFDDLGSPLHQVTFCIVDLETTGTSPTESGITEIGAVKVRGGEVLGTFQTLVNAGCAIPPEITVLTGITQSMVMRAPRIEAVLPLFLDFAAGCVLVAHNARFDIGFLNAACERAGYRPLDHDVLDTVALARRLVRDEVPNCRLATLAERLRLDHKPSHRALDDALATCDLLHVLIERAAGFGVLGLDDLLSLPKLGNHPQAAKLRLTDRLPRSPGIYLFRGGTGEVLYVGKATNLRQRVRSYFSSDDRRKIGSLLRETQRIDHVACASVLEAAVLEVRMIHRFSPRFNQQSKHWRRYCYLKLTLGERYPRLSIVKAPKGDGALYLGPIGSAATARLIADAIESVTRLRRCARRMGPRSRRTEALCTAAQLGVAACPCTGDLDEAAYRRVVDDVATALTIDPAPLLARLDARMADLAREARFEEAADVRDRAAALTRALERQRRLDGLRRAGRVVLALPDGLRAELHNGVLVGCWHPGATATLGLDIDPPPPDAPVPADRADELTCIDAWLQRYADRVAIVECEHGWALPRRPLPSYSAGRDPR